MLFSTRCHLFAMLVVGCSCSMMLSVDAWSAELVKVQKNGRETSLSQKLITVKANTPIFPNPTGEGKVEYVGAFNIFFHLKSDDGKVETLGKYRVGDENGRALGWVKVEDVQTWATRFAITPNVPNGSNQFEVQLTAGGQAVYDPGEIPSTAAAYSFITGDSQGTGANAEDDGPFPVCFCIAETGSAGAAEEANQIVNMALEVVFVIELTDFMLTKYDGRQLMDYVKDTAAEFAELAKKSGSGGDIPTRFGLVVFQDTNSDASVKRPEIVYPLSDDVDSWSDKVRSMKPEAIYGDWPEDGLSAISLALSSSMGWKSNSSKHVVHIGKASFQTYGRKQGGAPFRHYTSFIGDRSYYLWQDNWDEHFGFNSSGKTINDIHSLAFPQGGATGANLRQTYHLHAMRIGETTEQWLRRDLGDEYEETMSAIDGLEAAVSGLSTDQIIDAIGVDILLRVWGIEVSKNMDSLAVSQMESLATSGDTPGYFASVQPNPSSVRGAVANLREKVESAIDVIGRVAAGDLEMVQQESEGSGGTEFSKPIFRIVNSSMKDGEIIEQPVQTGVALVRSEATGRLVGNKVIMVSQTELTRLKGAFNSLYEQFDRKRSRAERQDVSGVLDELKTSLAVATSGQRIDSSTKLSDLITDLPLRTTALSMTPNDIAVMGTQDFEAWLEEIKLAEQRADLLLNDDAGRWISISSLGNSQNRYAFPKLADLP